MTTRSRKTTVFFGGWYQRTTLHLSEVFDFLAYAKSSLPLDKEELARLRREIGLRNVVRKTDSFEYVTGRTEDGVRVRYYEDGLYLFEKRLQRSIAADRAKIKEFYEQKWARAIKYLFSLGAPTPKELASIVKEHPVAVATNNERLIARVKMGRYGEIYSEVKSGEIEVYKTPEYIFVFGEDEKQTRGLVETQVFFREFKDQLESYLNIHRKIWEEISKVKEKGSIRGREVEEVRAKLDGYQKTISLIKSRINQMRAYVHTRSSIAKELEIEDKLQSLFQYKFETLIDTHAYISEIWNMTSEYVNTAIQVVVEVKSQSTDKNIQSLRWITTIGVLAGIVGYLARDSWPRVTVTGLGYFVVLLILTGLINWLVGVIYKMMRYRLKFVEKLGVEK